MKPLFCVMPDQMRKKMGMIMHYFEHRLSHIQARNLNRTQNEFRRTDQVHCVFLNRYCSKQALTWRFFCLMLPQALVCKTGGL
jgi:hypothetical protein